MKRRNLFILLALTFTVSATITSCKKDDDDNNSSGGLTLNTPSTVEGTFGGAPLNLTNAYGYVGWDGGIDPNGSNFNFISGIQQSFDVEEPNLNIRLGNIFYQNNDFNNPTTFHNYITKGSNAYAYIIGNSDGTTTKRVDIDYTDASSVGWGTQATSQTGSTFEILDTLHYTTLTGGLGIKFKAKFNCKLYDGSTVKTLNVTNYVGAFETYN